MDLSEDVSSLASVKWETQNEAEELQLTATRANEPSTVRRRRGQHIRWTRPRRPRTSQPRRPTRPWQC